MKFYRTFNSIYYRSKEANLKLVHWCSFSNLTEAMSQNKSPVNVLLVKFFNVKANKTLSLSTVIYHLLVRLKNVVVRQVIGQLVFDMFFIF